MNPSERATKQAYEGRQHFSKGAFPELRAACVRYGGRITRDLLELESEIDKFASQTEEGEQFASGRFAQLGLHAGFLDQLGQIEDKATYLRGKAVAGNGEGECCDRRDRGGAADANTDAQAGLNASREGSCRAWRRAPLVCMLTGWGLDPQIQADRAESRRGRIPFEWRAGENCDRGDNRPGCNQARPSVLLWDFMIGKLAVLGLAGAGMAAILAYLRADDLTAIIVFACSTVIVVPIVMGK